MAPARFGHCEAVFFDVDDTLYDFHASVDATLRRLQDRFPQPLASLAPADLVKAYWRANGRMTDAVKLALIEQDPFLYRRATWLLLLEDAAGPAATPAPLARFAGDRPSALLPVDAEHAELAGRLAGAFGDERFEHLQEAAYPGALATVRELAASGRTLGVITNGPSALQRAKVTALGLPALVPEPLILVSGEFGKRKPDPTIFEAALQRANVAPDRAVFIGDSVECDVGAKAVGMNVVFFAATATPPPDFKAACGYEPDAIAHSYDDVRRLLGVSAPS